MNYIPVGTRFFKTVRLGTCIHFACSAIYKQGFWIRPWAFELLIQKEFTVLEEERDIHLVSLTVAQLGFKKGALYKEICKEALSRQLELCPPEVGLKLRSQYIKQPFTEKLIIAMRAIKDFSGVSSLFHLEHDINGKSLGCSLGDDNFFWSYYEEFIFALAA